jgi:acyl-CoA synthetase (AMP-forming)/AMP-acid ligase II
VFYAKPANGNELQKSKGYLRSGDLGFISDNNLYFVGRLKDMIIINGLNYYPQDIELLVERSHDCIKPGCSGAFYRKSDGDYTENAVVIAEVGTVQYSVVYLVHVGIDECLQ